MNNTNDHYARFPSSLPHGSEFSFPQFPEIVGVEHEELAFNSYYSSVQNTANNNQQQGFYRPYDPISTSNNNDEWPLLNNGSGTTFGAGVVGNRNNLFGNSVASDFVEPSQPQSWTHFSEPTYYPHFANVNFWPHMYFQQTSSYESPTASVHDYRQSLPLDSAIDDSNGSAYELDIERIPVDSPAISISTPTPPPLGAQPMYPSDIFYHPTVQPSQQQITGVSNNVSQQQLPIRPIPQKSQQLTHQCSACYRYCVSAGGLKRHAKFCRASQSNLENIFASLKRPEQTESVPDASHQTEAHPINLSYAKFINQQPMSDVAPINFCMNDPVVEATLSSSENNHYSQSTATVTSIGIASTSAVPTPLPTPDTPSVPNLSTTSVVTFPPVTSLSSISSPKRAKIPESNNSRKRTCPQCPLVVPSEKALVDHLATHNVDKPYSCATCGSTFSRKFHLTRHVKQRGCDGTPRAQYPCEHCNKIFSRKDNLREHVKVHTGQSKPRSKLPCPIPSCNKEFQGRTQLQVHLNFHSGLRPYACEREECKKTFRSNAALKKHLRIHILQKPFQCPQCDARFTAKETLSHHMADHDLLRPIKSYLCKKCGMAFIQQTHLSDHMIEEHRTMESFECTVCSRTYKRRWRLQRHFRLEHTDKSVSGQSEGAENSRVDPVSSESLGNNQQTCKVCSKVFMTKQSLKAHVMTHVVEPPVACAECSRAFIRKDCLLRHLRTKHNLMPDQAVQVMRKMNERTSSGNERTSPDSQPTNQDDTCSSDAAFLDLITDTNNSCSMQISSNEPPDPMTIFVGDFIDVSLLEGNIIELLSLLVDPNAMNNFGWPNNSVDAVLQSVLVKCGKAPVSNTNLTVAQRLRANTKMLFSFIVDDQAALENLFSRRPVEQVLQQVIQLAKSSENSDNIVQLPI